MKTIKINHIAKIEGHAKLHIKVNNKKVEKVSLDIFEGSRFFEGILKNKKHNDMADISSRICGICSVAHNVCSHLAVEDAFNIKISEQTKKLRELLTIGGILQSHILHLYFMVLPDFLGYDNAIQMVNKYKNEITRALRMKKLYNDLVRIIAGRDIHPIGSRVGGFTRIPDKKEIKNLLKELKKGSKDSLETLKLFSKLKYPRFSSEKEYFSLQGKNYFDFQRKILCLGKKCINVEDYEKHFNEYFKKDSTAEFVSVKKSRGHSVGALARVLNNQCLLTKTTKKYFNLINEDKFNPHMNTIAQAIEVHEGVNRVINILDKLKLKEESIPNFSIKKAVGFGATEAPRGILFHKYEFDKDGFSKFVNITTPTTQNLKNIEESIKLLLPKILNQSKEKIQLEIEKLIRAYDPCISCATHFLEINWE